MIAPDAADRKGVRGRTGDPATLRIGQIRRRALEREHARRDRAAERLERDPLQQ